MISLLVWFATPVGELMPQARAALESDTLVKVNREPWLSFEPTPLETNTGFIFYPGGRVMAEAYAPLARAVAENGYLVIVPSMPLNFAILNPNIASDIIPAHPDIGHWVIGGHSLGGVMAARFAHDQPQLVDGLVLLAAYPEAHIDLSSRELSAAMIYGDSDGLVSIQEVENALSQLPENTRKLLISGGNHAQFGWYGAQAGDNPAQINREQQLAQVLSAILPVMADAGK